MRQHQIALILEQLQKCKDPALIGLILKLLLESGQE
jgi:hypothetical protein